MAASVFAWGAVAMVSPGSTPADVLQLVSDRPNRDSVAWKLQHHHRVNLLLLGRGGNDEESANFTDTIFVLSLHPPTDSATLISLPRFLLVDIPAAREGVITGRLYSAFAIGSTRSESLRPRWRTETGAGDLTAATVGAVIGQQIDGWIAVDLRSFEDIVDSVGGIQLTVPRRLIDRTYPREDGRGTTTIHFAAGQQSMDGERAEEYVRSRLSTSESDRMFRQTLVLEALIKRVQAVGIGFEVLRLLFAARNGALTDLRVADIRALAAAAHHLDLRRLKRLSIDEPGLVHAESAGGVYVVVPNDPGWTGIREFVVSNLP